MPCDVGKKNMDDDTEIRNALLQEMRKERGNPLWEPKLLNGRKEWERRLKEKKELHAKAAKANSSYQ